MDCNSERAEKKIGDERRERIGLETRDSLEWWDQGTRARQFRATSSGSVGIRSGGSLLLLLMEEDMARGRLSALPSPRSASVGEVVGVRGGWWYLA